MSSCGREENGVYFTRERVPKGLEELKRVTGTGSFPSTGAVLARKGRENEFLTI